MGKPLWRFLDRLYEQYYPAHVKKISSMAIREEKLVAANFKKGSDEETTAVCFKVVNKDTSSGAPSLHNVCIARHPDKKILTMWCGDSKVAKEDKEPESKCEWWGKFKANGEDAGYACKHIVYVLKETDDRHRKEIEELLGVSAAIAPPGDGLSLALKLGKSALLYGPTGSRKTYKVRQMLKGLEGTEVFKLHLTDGLEDVDLLHKLLPDPDGKGWKRIEGELRVAFNTARHKKVVVVLEELTRTSRSLRNLLIKAMDKEDNQYTLHDITTGERITVPAANLVFIGTANLSYADTSELDPALARRFPICMFQDYELDVEKKILEGILEKKVAARLLAITKAVREQHRNGILPYPLDTGSLIEWAEVVKSGVDIVEAAQLTWVFRIVERDGHGYPEGGQLSAVLEELTK